MGDISSPKPVLLLVAVTSRYKHLLDWAEETMCAKYGPLMCKSSAFSFTETDYYEASMGTDLLKQFFAFEQLVEPGVLADVKIQTNEWEEQTPRDASDEHFPERPLNLDPGYITLAKLVLASTKDHSHRLYLRDGIYAELTLSFHSRQWQKFRWTYPDYCRNDFHEFFNQCRKNLLK